MSGVDWGMIALAIGVALAAGAFAWIVADIVEGKWW